MSLERWFYKGGRPNKFAKLLNHAWAMFHTLGLFKNYLVTLVVSGRQSGKPISFPLVLTDVNGERYLVSMLGNDANWVRNLKAAGGRAELLHGIREEVLLEKVDVQARPAILKAYLQIAPGARPHIPVDKNAPLQDFEKIAAQYPVFKITTVRSQ